MPSGDIEPLDKTDHARRQLQLLADISDPALALFDTSRRFTLTNDAFNKRFGEPSESVNAAEFFDGVCSPAVDQYLKRALEDNEALLAQLDCTGQDGSTDRLRFKAIPQVINDSVSGIYVSFQEPETRPLPDENAIKPDLRHDEIRDHLERMARLGEMAAGLTHEIRQPLAAIINYAAALKLHLRNHPSSDSIVGLVDQIVEQTRRADGIVSSARSMVGKGQLPHIAFNIVDVINDCMVLVERRARQMDVDIRLGVRADLPDVNGNPHQIEQIIVNLVNNALDAMEDSDERVLSLDVTTAINANDQRTMRVTVSDTGPGIPAEHRATMFRAMETSKHDGMGMGLSISRTLAEHHHGTLRAEDDTDAGAVFILELPIERADSI